MCGITGIINLRGLDLELEKKSLARMSETLSARGPDEEGFYFDACAALAHRRLSIIDLASGQQPITTPDGRFTIVYNGETYNFLELRDALSKKGYSFKTHSDTETVLQLYADKGARCLDEMNGMFAFVIWDHQEKTLFAARDRLGKKPFYYTLINGTLLFASELKAILKHPLVQRRIEPRAIPHFLTYEYVPAPLTMIAGVHKLKQGHFLTFSAAGLVTQRYWNQTFASKSPDDENTACHEILSRLDNAVRARLIADVPVGVFLSGGIDSSAVVALLARHKQAKDIKTFSINFKEASYDESDYSSLVAKKFGTDHHTQTLTAGLMLDILPQVTSYLDEPFADGSILPTYLLSRFTRGHVKVALGGDGGDELFAGYPTFFANRLANIYNRFPAVLRRAARRAVDLLPVSDKNMSLDFKARQFLQGAEHAGEMAIRNQLWLAGITPHDQRPLYAQGFYESIRDQDPLDLIRNELRSCDSPEPTDQLLYFYQRFYMCDDILVKVDRASMANSLEVRAPFLDPHVVAYANSLPYHLKLRGRTSKYILKRALANLLPHEIIHRPKKGFGIPVSSWLKNELRDLLLHTLRRGRIERDGFFDFAAIDALIQGHLSGKRNNRKPLFTLLMLHLWMDHHL